MNKEEVSLQIWGRHLIGMRKLQRPVMHEGRIISDTCFYLDRVAQEMTPLRFIGSHRPLVRIFRLPKIALEGCSQMAGEEPPEKTADFIGFIRRLLRGFLMQ